jgi:hypothetical protein
MEVSDMTLLQDFMADRVAKYRVPARKGKGLSGKLHRASLQMLTASTQREISASLGMSYGYLRNRSTRPEFREAVNGHCIEFSMKVLSFVQESTHAVNGEMPDLYGPFGDFGSYSPRLRATVMLLLDVAAQEAIREGNYKLLAVLYRAVTVFRISEHRTESGKWIMTATIKRKELEMLGNVRKALLGRIRKFARKSELSEAEKEEAAIALWLLGRTILCI